jgi:hypothetical protein
VPGRPGSYTFVFQYAFAVRAQAEYTVAAANLEADAMARLHDIMFSDQPGKVPPHPVPMYVHVLAMRSNGETYICVQQKTVSNARPIVSKEYMNTRPSIDRVSLVPAVPFKRVSTSSSPITTLSATADADENLTIEWTDSDGRKDHLYYSASYPARK